MAYIETSIAFWGLGICYADDVIKFTFAALRIQTSELQIHISRNVDRTISLDDVYDDAVVDL